VKCRNVNSHCIASLKNQSAGSPMDIQCVMQNLSSSEPLPNPNTAEFLCLKCDFVADTPQLCPKHRLVLLEFSDWVETKQKKSERLWKTISWVILIVGLALAIYSI